MYKSLFDYLNTRMEALEERRKPFEEDYRALATNFCPRRGRFFANEKNKNSRKNNLINDKPIDAANILAAGMASGMASASRPWFRVSSGDPDLDKFGPAREWLDGVTKKMEAIFHASNFYKVLPVGYKELGVFGTAARFMDKDFKTVVRFTPMTVGEYFIGRDASGRVDTFGRQYSSSVRNIVAKFGYERCSQTIQQMYDRGDYAQEVELSHLIEPAGLHDDPRYKVPEMFNFVSCVWEKGETSPEAKPLKVKGYHEFPLTAPVWERVSDEDYGISPGMNAIGDAKALQVKEKELGKAIALMARPPTKGKSQNSSAANIIAGGHTPTNDDIQAIYQVDPRVAELIQDIQRTEYRIDRAFSADLFKMMSVIDDRDRTAREIVERHEEKLTLLGPVVQNIDDDDLDPTCARLFNMIVRLSEQAWKDGSGSYIIKPPPKELVDIEMMFEYTSVMAQAQKMAETRHIQEYSGFIAQLASVKPAVLDKLNEDKAAEEYAEALGVPGSIVNDDNEAGVIRENRAKQEQAAQAMEVASTAASAAKDLGQADTGEGSMLSQLMRG